MLKYTIAIAMITSSLFASELDSLPCTQQIDELKKSENFVTSYEVKKLFAGVVAQYLDSVNEKCINGCNEYKIKAINNSLKWMQDSQMTIRHCDTSKVWLNNLIVRSMNPKKISLVTDSACIDNDSVCAYFYAYEKLQESISRVKPTKSNKQKLQKANLCLEELAEKIGQPKMNYSTAFDWYFDENNETDQQIMQEASVGGRLSISGYHGYIQDFQILIQRQGSDNSYGIAIMGSRTTIPIYSNASLFSKELYNWSIGNDKVKACIERLKMLE